MRTRIVIITATFRRSAKNTQIILSRQQLAVLYHCFAIKKKDMDEIQQIKRLIKQLENNELDIKLAIKNSRYEHAATLRDMKRKLHELLEHEVSRYIKFDSKKHL